MHVCTQYANNIRDLTPSPLQGKGAMKTYFCEGLADGKAQPDLVKGRKEAAPAPAIKAAPTTRAPPKGYRPLAVTTKSPNGSIESSPGLGAHITPTTASEPLLKKLNSLEDSAV